MRSNFFPLLSWYLVLCTLYLIPSCKKDAPAPDLGYGYAPNNVGHWVIYQIDSTAEDDQTVGRKTYQFQIKEVIESIFTDNQGRPTMRLERYRKNYDSLVPYSQQQWTGPRVYYANLTSSTYERVEENFRYTRMIFPVKLGDARWNANAGNVLDAWTGKYTAVDQPGTVNNLSFDSVVSVQEENNINLVTTVYAEAKYATNVGLIYRQLLLLNKQPDSQLDSIPFHDTLGFPSSSNYSLLSDKAILYTQQIVSWGN